MHMSHDHSNLNGITQGLVLASLVRTHLNQQQQIANALAAMGPQYKGSFQPGTTLYWQSDQTGWNWCQHQSNNWQLIDDWTYELHVPRVFSDITGEWSVWRFHETELSRFPLPQRPRPYRPLKIKWRHGSAERLRRQEANRRGVEQHQLEMAQYESDIAMIKLLREEGMPLDDVMQRVRSRHEVAAAAEPEPEPAPQPQPRLGPKSVGQPGGPPYWPPPPGWKPAD
jgi:hypothetical protein